MAVHLVIVLGARRLPGTENAKVLKRVINEIDARVDLGYNDHWSLLFRRRRDLLMCLMWPLHYGMTFYRLFSFLACSLRCFPRRGSGRPFSALCVQAFL